MSSIKIIRASQATHIYLYKNLRSKILKRCTSIYFNKQCLKLNPQLPHTPKYHIPPQPPHTPNKKYVNYLNVVLYNCFIYNLL